MLGKDPFIATTCRCCKEVCGGCCATRHGRARGVAAGGGAWGELAGTLDLWAAVWRGWSLGRSVVCPTAKCGVIGRFERPHYPPRVVLVKHYGDRFIAFLHSLVGACVLLGVEGAGEDSNELAVGPSSTLRAPCGMSRPMAARNDSVESVPLRGEWCAPPRPGVDVLGVVGQLKHGTGCLIVMDGMSLPSSSSRMSSGILA
eukprot:scaffold248417_cov67-Attheya_sp.AAC.1